MNSFARKNRKIFVFSGPSDTLKPTSDSSRKTRAGGKWQRDENWQPVIDRNQHYVVEDDDTQGAQAWDQGNITFRCNMHGI